MSVRINSEQAAALGLAGPTAGRSKYRAKRTEYRGVWYDSAAEADRAAALDGLESIGSVAWRLEQVKFRLGCPENTWRVDFVVAVREAISSDRVLIHAEDCKGFETQKFRRDRVLWKRYGPFPLWLIKRGKLVEVIKPGIDAEDAPR